MEDKVEGEPDGHVLGLWEESRGHPHPEDVESPPRKTPNRESNPQPRDQSCPKTNSSRKIDLYFSDKGHLGGQRSHRTEKAS